MARLLSVVVLGVCFSIIVLRDLSARREHGREAYLAKQAEWFDRYVSKQNDPVTVCVTGVAFSGLLFGAYELLGVAIFAVIKPRREEGAA